MEMRARQGNVIHRRGRSKTRVGRTGLWNQPIHQRERAEEFNEFVAASAPLAELAV